MDAHLINFFKTKKSIKLVIGTLVAANAISAFTPTIGAQEQSQSFYELGQVFSDDITLEEMRNMIYSSSRLTDEEKAFLYNEDLFMDVLPYINQSETMKRLYRAKFDNLDIKDYGSIIKAMTKTNGFYWSNLSPNLYVAYYDGIGNPEDATVAHEYMHATQQIDTYLFFIEPAAEIAAHEYYGAPIDSYKEEVKYLEMLMEIIGSEPIKQYMYTGDFSMIEERIRPNLDEEDYAEFMGYVTSYNRHHSALRNVNLDRIYQTLYYNIYGVSMRKDGILMAIKNDNRTINRYYFNDRLTDEYYILGEYVADGNTIWPTIVPVRHDIEPIATREAIFTHKNKGDSEKGF